MKYLSLILLVIIAHVAIGQGIDPKQTENAPDSNYVQASGVNGQYDHKAIKDIHKVIQVGSNAYHEIASNTVFRFGNMINLINDNNALILDANDELYIPGGVPVSLSPYHDGTQFGRSGNSLQLLDKDGAVLDDIDISSFTAQSSDDQTIDVLALETNDILRVTIEDGNSMTVDLSSLKQGLPGPQGDTGPQGSIGNTGPVGPVGPQGPTGATGSQGIQGLVGPIGNTGSQGIQGIKGDKGDTGDTGPQGSIGLTGDTGTQGPIGPTGLTGDIGPEGPIGLTGSQGIQGIQGIQGVQGEYLVQHPQVTNVVDLPATGNEVNDARFVTSTGDLWIYTDALTWENDGPIQGPPGNDGANGIDGNDGDSAYDVAVADGFIGTEAAWLLSLVGSQGGQGIQGVQGPIGNTGAKGNTGAAGANGSNGAAATIAVGNVSTGNPGTNASVSNQGSSSAAVLDFSIPRGAQGFDGDDGAVGPAGPTGPQGNAGSNGSNGTNGADGLSVLSGTTNPTTQGKTGDLYVNTVTNQLWKKFNNGWFSQFNMRGPTGLTGSQGSAGANGQNGSTGATGPKGDDGAQGPQGNDGDPATDDQNLSNGTSSGNNRTINIDGGTGVTFSVADGDASTTNETPIASTNITVVGRNVSLSPSVTQLDFRVSNLFRVPIKGSALTGACSENGVVAYANTIHKLKVCSNGTWVALH